MRDLSPSASSASTARRARSRPSASRSCAAPILASRSLRPGGAARALAPGSCGVADFTRCEPTPMAIPKDCAASLRCRLMASARGMPPVMELISSGACMVLPSSEARRSICVRPNPAMRSARSRLRPWPGPRADPARCPDGRPCAGPGRRRSCSLHPSHRATALRRIGPRQRARRRLPRVQAGARCPPPAESLR
ncbi:hypothetical protein GA0061098_101190 [Bradyrhizobium shewense]|uniref:Uncharacterized protein n=1 Tax=Bradyrhizobium shewense TaxID=1761772 RepID=A0A1C3X0I9_9BRAD|nr:hypothetical protein GA0061098_101190 [Bradyrhizobium shewense]